VVVGMRRNILDSKVVSEGSKSKTSHNPKAAIESSTRRVCVT